VKPAPFSYRRPGDLQEALAALAGEPNAKVLAGGQSLVPLLSMRLAAPALLVDINGLPDLDGIAVNADGVRLGALARHAAVLADADARRVQPLLALALSNVAHPTIRNRGTTVGSLVHADAAAEMPVVLKLLAGSLDVASVRGTRTIEADDLYLGPLESSVAHDEIAVSAYFPALPADAGVGFSEISRRHGDYAMCGVAAVVRRSGDTVVEARAGYLSVSDVPTVVDLTASLAGGVTDDALAAAGEAALAGLEPADDIHATAAYRAQLVRVLTGRVLRSAYDDAGARAAAQARQAAQTAATHGEDEHA
jgi:2-furoyl-CoA dehydrogenase FAD binding subunit